MPWASPRLVASESVSCLRHQCCIRINAWYIAIQSTIAATTESRIILVAQITLFQNDRENTGRVCGIAKHLKQRAATPTTVSKRDDPNKDPAFAFSAAAAAAAATATATMVHAA